MIAPSLPADATPTRFSAGFSISARLRNVRGAVITMSALVATSMTALAVTVPAGGHGDDPAHVAEVDQPEHQLGRTIRDTFSKR